MHTLPPLKPKEPLAMTVTPKSLPLKSTALQRGLSLVELVVVLAVIGIITSIAVPQYNDYIIKSSIHAAQKILTDQSLLIEDYYQQKNTYVGGCSVVTFTGNKDWSPQCNDALFTKSDYLLIVRGKKDTVFSKDADPSKDQSNTVSIHISNTGPSFSHGEVIGWAPDENKVALTCWPTSKYQKTCAGTGS
jgi:type IV pilus assembly protein PilE